MSKKESKETKKMHYIKLIRENEPIHPEELRTVLGLERVRYDYIDELCFKQKIDKKKYGRNYVLLFMPGHEAGADKRYYDDTPKKDLIFPSEEKEKIENGILIIFSIIL